MSEVIHYVAGMLFNRSGTFTAIIRKQKPAWQAGRLNAIGGKIEPGEDPVTAMHREFLEETGVDIPAEQWEHVAILTGENFVCHFFGATSDALWGVRTMEEEEVGVMRIDRLLLSEFAIPNLRFLIPLALDRSGITKPVMLYDGIPNP